MNFFVFSFVWSVEFWLAINTELNGGCKPSDLSAEFDVFEERIKRWDT